MKKRMPFLLLLTAMAALMFIRCMFDDAESFQDGPAQITALKVYGIVTNEAGEPVAGARVKTENGLGSVVFTETDAFGFFAFESVRAKNRRIILQADKEGYFHKSYATTAGQGTEIKVQFILNTKQIVLINSQNPGSIAIATQAMVHFEANSFVTQSGAPYNGEVEVAYTYANPQSAEFSRIMQGGDLMGQNANGQLQHLISYGAVAVELTGSSGEALNLAPGQTATIEMTIPDEQLAQAPSTIPLWYFDDEKNLWIEEGFATLQGNKYVGQVSHFSWWNCDDPITPNTYVQGKVFDCRQNPLAGVAVTVGPIVVFTNADGYYTANVAAGLLFNVFVSPMLNGGIGSIETLSPGPVAAGTTVTLPNLNIPCTSYIGGAMNICDAYTTYIRINMTGYPTTFYYAPPNFSFPVKSGVPFSVTLRLVNSLGEQTFNYNVPALEPDATHILFDSFTTGCPVALSGRLVDCNQNPVSGLVSITWSGGAATLPVSANGNFNFYVPANADVTINASTTSLGIFTQYATLQYTPTVSEGSETLPNFAFKCPVTLNGTVTDCGGLPISTTVKLAWDGQIKYVSSTSGSFSALVPGNADITISAQAYAGVGLYSGETVVNTIENQTANAALALCTLMAEVDCILGVQVNSGSGFINFGSLNTYTTAPQMGIPLTTSSQGVYVITNYAVPAGYTQVRISDGPIKFSLVLPSPVQTGTYNISNLPPVAFGQPVGALMVNNTSITFLLTEGQITISEANGSEFSGTFTGSIGSLLGHPQLPAPFMTGAVGAFCISY